jgi:hypothetical protein
MSKAMQDIRKSGKATARDLANWLEPFCKVVNPEVVIVDAEGKEYPIADVYVGDGKVSLSAVPYGNEPLVRQASTPIKRLGT